MRVSHTVGVVSGGLRKRDVWGFDLRMRDQERANDKLEVIKIGSMSQDLSLCTKAIIVMSLARSQDRCT